MVDERRQGDLQFNQALLGLFAQRNPEVGHAGAGQPVKNVLALLTGFHETRQPQFLQVGARQLDTDVRLRGQDFDRLLPLAQQFDKFEALGAGDRLRDAGNLRVEVVLDRVHAHSLTNIRMMSNSSVDARRFA